MSNGLRIETDLALRRLNALGAFFTAAARSLERPPAGIAGRLGGLVARRQRGSRLSVGGGRRDGELRTLREVTLVRAVSVLEAFVIDLGEDVLLSVLAEAEDDPRLKALSDYLFHAHWDRVNSQGGWEKALDTWKDGIGVNPKTFDEWEELDLMRTTRHAIVHRLGELTPQYRKKPLGARRLEALGLDLSKASGLIPLDSADVFNGLELSRRFVRWLDGELGQGR